MNKCKFQTIADNTHKCSVCGFIIKINQSPDKLNRTCSTSQSPTLLEKAANLYDTTKEWVKSGMEITEQKEADERLKICQSCEYFNKNSCTRCGCNMNVKVKMKSARCPENKW